MTLNVQMSFDGYYSATEHAFAAEKEQMIDRIVQARELWKEAAMLDRESCRKCEELQNMKKLLSKGSLQLLRTKEEILRIRLLNAQSSYRLRQLQDEIWRFLPHAQGNVSTVDYQLSIGKPQGIPEPLCPIKPDDKLSKDLKSLRRDWTAILELQGVAFSEELNRRVADGQCFAKFVDDFKRQNSNSHAEIEKILEKIVKRSILVQSSAKDNVTRHQSTITIMKRKQKVLSEKADFIAKTASEKTFAEREKAQQQANISTNAVRQRIQNLERNNLRKFAYLKEQNTDLHQRNKALSESVANLKKREMKLLKQNTGFAEHGKAKIEKLECQLNAIISAAAALEDCPREEESRVLNAVAGAVGNHAATVSTIDALDLKIQMVKARLNRLR